METVAIVGLGLIGGSFGLSLRAAGFAGRVLGVSEPIYVQTAMRVGAITEASTLEESLRFADVIYLSDTVSGILQTIQTISGRARTDTLITDVGSTKRAIAQQAREYLSAGHFLGGHPMAGKEQRGIEAAEAGLFRQRPYVLTQVIGGSPHEAAFRSWLERMGALVIDMTPLQHDRAVAFTSHLPQLISTALAASLAQQNEDAISVVFGPGLLDMTRLALSDAGLWSSILETNSDQIAEALAYFVLTLQALQAGKPNPGQQVATFEQAATFARSLRLIFTKT